MQILFQDADVLVVAKPPGQYVHPSPGHETGTLTDELVARFPEMAEVGSRERPGVVHRLDAETSGVMIFARSQRAYLKLRAAFESHTDIEKTYLACVHGVPPQKTGTRISNIGRKPWDPKRMAENVPEGARAVTHWETLLKRNGLALVEFRIETGRTHQIRVHAAALGCPIVGDALYGDPVRDARLHPRPARTLLHAVQIAFSHPVSNRRLTFAVPPPADLLRV